MNINEMVLYFINSKDIAEHLKNIDYQFSTPEAAFLVFSSRKVVLEAKFKAWKKIIDEMPDCSMEERLNMMAIPSIHQFLKDYIALQNRHLEYFHKNDGAVYFYGVKYEDDPYPDFGRPFSCLEKCKEELLSELEYMKEYEAVEIFIKKTPLDNSKDAADKNCCVQYTSDMRILNISRYAVPDELYDIDTAFEGMWFRIPTPFKKGDIVVEPTKSMHTLEYDVPLVLSDDIWGEGYINEKPKYRESRKKLIEKLEKNGDISDMTYSGCWVKDDGFYYEVGHDYLSLEYYRKPLTDEYRFLKALSMYFKDECNLEFLIDAKDIIFGEKKIKERKRYLNQLPKIIQEVGIAQD